MKLLRHLMAVAVAAIITQAAPDTSWKKWTRGDSYDSEDKDPFLIVADDEHVPDDDDLQDTLYSSTDESGSRRGGFVIRVDEDEPTKEAEDEEGEHEDLEREQNRYIADVWGSAPESESDGRRRDGRNAQQIRDQAARDLAEMNADLARQREAQRRQDAADRARERDELRRYELELRRQLEEQRRKDALQVQADARQALRDRTTNVQGAPSPGRLAQQSAYEEYDAYNYDPFYN